MRKFAFPLERLLRLRKSRELERARSLVDALLTHRKRKAAFHEHRDRHDIAREHACALPAATVAAGLLTNLYRAIDQIAVTANVAASGVRSAKESVERARDEYEQARRDRYALERLRERRRRAWKQEVARQEQREFDEIATQMAAGRYNR